MFRSICLWDFHCPNLAHVGTGDLYIMHTIETIGSRNLPLIGWKACLSFLYWLPSCLYKLENVYCMSVSIFCQVLMYCDIRLMSMLSASTLERMFLLDVLHLEDSTHTRNSTLLKKHLVFNSCCHQTVL